jgi:hypothetical protein
MFRFTIRDLLWLILLAAVLVMWGMDHRRLSAELEKLNETFGPLEGAGVNRYYSPPNPAASDDNQPSE